MPGKQKNRSMSGQSLVEFALGLMIFLSLALAFVEFGPLVQAWINVQECAQAAVRYASTGQQGVAPGVDQWDTARLNAIKTEARAHTNNLVIKTTAGQFEPGYFRVNVYASDSPTAGKEYPGGPNARVAVDVMYNYPLVTPFLSRIWPWVRLGAHVEYVVERFRNPGFGTPAGVLPPTIAPTPVPTNTPTPKP